MAVDYNTNKKRENYILNNDLFKKELNSKGFSNFRLTINGSREDLADKIDFFAEKDNKLVSCQLKVRSKKNWQGIPEVTIRTTGNTIYSEWYSSKAEYYFGVYLDTSNLDNYKVPILHITCAYVKPIYEAIRGNLKNIQLYKCNLNKYNEYNIPQNFKNLFYDLRGSGACSKELEDGRIGIWVNELNTYDGGTFAIINNNAEKMMGLNIFI